jgi:hypothetical protein
VARGTVLPDEPLAAPCLERLLTFLSKSAACQRKILYVLSGEAVVLDLLPVTTDEAVA